MAQVLVFLSSAPGDRELRDELLTHLQSLERAKAIAVWHPDMMQAGEACVPAIRERLDAAEVILLLISAGYLAAGETVAEMDRALVRHAQGTAVVVPVLLRACHVAPEKFTTLQMLPRSGRAVMSWERRDEAFAEIAGEIGKLVRGRAAAKKPAVTRGRGAEVHRGVEHLFVGREAELEKIEKALLPGSPMPVAIGALQGMAGVGKSYLADRFAFLHRDTFPGGYVKISLSPDLPRSAEEIAGDVAGKVDLSWGGAGSWERLRARLQQPRTLVHIENADSDDLARTTAQVAAELIGCTMLISGRSQRIGRGAGWRRVDVGALDEAKALEQIEQERGAKTTDKERESLKGLARELGYLPLALHLAGGHLRERSIEGFLTLFRARKLALKPADLGDPLLLQDEPRAIVSTTFALSLDLLRKQLGDRGDAWMISFARIGHAPLSGIGRSLGAAMAGMSELDFEELMVEATYLSLATKVIREGTDEGAWSLHPLLAELLRGTIEGDGRWLEGMTAWFLKRLPRLPYEQVEEQGKLRIEAQREHDALVSWLALVPLSEAAQVVEAGSDYADLHGPFAAWLGFCERLLQSTEDPQVRSNALWTLCQVALKSGAIERAKEAAEEKVRLDRERGDEREAALGLGVIADIYEARGQLDEALRILRDEALPVFERLGDVRERAVTMGQIADIYQARGQLDEALRIRRDEALPVYERLGDVRSRAITMGQIADIYQARGQFDEALRIRRDEALPAFERLGDVRELLVGRANLALLHLKRNHPGDRETAADLLRLALCDAEAMRIPEAEQIRAIQQELGL